MVIVWGKIEARASTLAEVTRLSLEHVHRSRNEPGCLRHSVQVDLENPCRLVFYEEWQDMAALHCHFGVADSTQFLDRVTELAVGPPSMKIFDATQIS
jgi:quinol monooxygenase YgiN